MVKCAVDTPYGRRCVLDVLFAKRLYPKYGRAPVTIGDLFRGGPFVEEITASKTDLFNSPSI